jgi:nitrile hydratase
MNGAHDVGGMQDMGPIRPEHNEPVFHTEWERRVFALFNAVDVEWPYRRTQIELIPPADYLRMSYYEKWLTALPQILIKTGMATPAEIESGKAVGGVATGHHVLTGAEVATWNTRLPRYVRGKVGTIERDGDVEELQDSDIQALGPKQQHVYTVRFAARELWGDQANSHDYVYVALWEGYLESA